MSDIKAIRDISLAMGRQLGPQCRTVIALLKSHSYTWLSDQGATSQPDFHHSTKQQLASIQAPGSEYDRVSPTADLIGCGFSQHFTPPRQRTPSVHRANGA